MVPPVPLRKDNIYNDKTGGRAFGEWGIGTAARMNSKKIATVFGISLMYVFISFRSTHLNADVTITSKRPLVSMNVRKCWKRSLEVNY